MDGRKVEDVEAEPGHVGQQGLHVGQGAGAGGVGGGGAGEDLVPAAEAGPGPLHLDRVGLGDGGRPRVGVAGHELSQLRAGGRLDAVGPSGRRDLLEAVGEEAEPLPVGALGPPRSPADQVGPDEELDGEGLAGPGPGLERPAPAAEMIDGGPNGKLVATDPPHRELPPPAVVAEGCQGGGAPPGLRLATEAYFGKEFVVAVGEDVGLHDDGFTEGPFGRVAAAVDGGPHPGDDGPGSAEGLGEGSSRLSHRNRRFACTHGPRTHPPCVGR